MNQEHRSSLLHSWINSYGMGSSSNPYLAYPDLPKQIPTKSSADSLASYDLFHDLDIPPASRPSFSSSSSSFALSVSPSKSIRSFFSAFRSHSQQQQQPEPPLSSLMDQDSIIDNLDFLPPPSNRFSRGSSTSIDSKSSSAFKRDSDSCFSSLSRSARKKRKLIISGIAATETRKFQAVKSWCESFGQLRAITRQPNGDLLVDFKDPDVADTVCRIRAKVFINGAGSVQLSWIFGNKR